MRSIFKKHRIDYLLYGGFSGFVVILLVMVIGLSYTLSTRETAKNTSFYQQSLLSELYNKVEIQMRSVENISLAAARNAVLSEYTGATGDLYADYRKREELKSYLMNIVNATPVIQSIHYYTNHEIPSDTKGPVVFFNNEKTPDEAWYGSAENADFAWLGEHTIKSFNGEISVISFARKVYSETGDYRGILLLNMKASAIQNLISGESPGESRVLLDSGGRILTLVGDPHIEQKIAEYLSNMHDTSGYLKISTAQAEDYLLVWAKHFNGSWIVVELTPWAQITQGSVRTAFVLAAAGVSALVISLFFTLLFSNQFIKPIRLLLAEMGRYSGSTKKVNLPEDYHNEFGVLFSGYIKLIDRIQKLYVSLEDQYKRQRNAEIKALQAMINPHFLYNTLDQLNWMAIEAGQDRMSYILELMGTMFRIGLSNGESLITLREELLHTDCYVKIQQLRWEEGLTVEIDVPEKLKPIFIPKMTLQPFVENAVMHGFTGRKEGRIEIKAVEEDGMIAIRISDNGVGLKPNWDEAKKRSTGGYGIRNVRERFEAFFDGMYGLEIRNNENGKGTTVHLRLPVLLSREMEEKRKNLQ